MPHEAFKYKPGLFDHEEIYISRVAWRDFRKAFAQICGRDGFALMDQFEQACKRIGHNTARLLIEVAIFEFLEKTDAERKAGYHRLCDLHNLRDQRESVLEEYRVKLQWRDTTAADNNRQRLDLEFDPDGKLIGVTAQHGFYGSGYAMTKQIAKQLAERDREPVEQPELQTLMQSLGFDDTEAA